MNPEATRHDLVITRILDVPVEQVWQAWSEEEYVKQWWGPTGFTCPVASWSLQDSMQHVSVLSPVGPKPREGKAQYACQKR